MSAIIHMLSNFILGDLSPYSKSRQFLSFRFISNLGAFFFLIFGYVLGCRALYHYLEPQLGEAKTLLVLCSLLLVTSLVLFFISWLLKPPESPIQEIVHNVEKVMTDLPSSQTVKDILSHMSTKTIATIFALAFVTSYLTKSGKKLLFENLNAYGGQHGKKISTKAHEE